MNPDIMLALLNIEALLGGKGKPSKESSESLQKKLNNINKQISTYLVDMKRVAPPTSRMSLKDWNNIKTRINQPVDESTMFEWLDSLPEEVDREMAAVAVSELMGKLRPIMPINVSTTLTGYDEREPSDYEKSKFIRQVRVLENPFIILDLIRSNALTGTEVDALKLFYPSIYEQFTSAILEALSDLSGKNGGEMVYLPLEKNRTLALFLGVPRVTPTQMAMYQKTGTAEADKAEISQPTSQTDTQRVALK